MVPAPATRGAVVNALCHRDYTTPGGAVAVTMYDHHLEIINPGTFRFDIIPEKLIRPGARTLPNLRLDAGRPWL